MFIRTGEVAAVGPVEAGCGLARRPAYSQEIAGPRVDRAGIPGYFVHGWFFVRRHLEALNGGTGSAPAGSA